MGNEPEITRHFHVLPRQSGFLSLALTLLLLFVLLSQVCFLSLPSLSLSFSLFLSVYLPPPPVGVKGFWQAVHVTPDISHGEQR